jgi:hypothetical protein
LILFHIIRYNLHFIFTYDGCTSGAGTAYLSGAHEFSVTPLFELGSDFEPLFLKIGNNIPSPQLSGIIPLSNIITRI